jgi:hypothetical protein
VILAHIGRVALAVTTNLNINFLKKPAPGALDATASDPETGQTPGGHRYRHSRRPMTRSGGACDGNLFNSATKLSGMEHDALMWYNNTVFINLCFY